METSSRRVTCDHNKSAAGMCHDVIASAEPENQRWGWQCAHFSSANYIFWPLPTIRCNDSVFIGLHEYICSERSPTGGSVLSIRTRREASAAERRCGFGSLNHRGARSSTLRVCRRIWVNKNLWSCRVTTVHGDTSFLACQNPC